MKYFTFVLLLFAGAVISAYLKSRGMYLGMYFLGYLIGMIASYILDYE